MSSASYHADQDQIPPQEWAYRGIRRSVPSPYLDRRCGGYRSTPHVTRNGDQLLPPSGDADDFNWGYPGNGPSNLAHAILLDYTANEELAERMASWFKEDIIALLPDSWAFTGAHIDRWLVKWQAVEPLFMPAQVE